MPLRQRRLLNPERKPMQPRFSVLRLMELTALIGATIAVDQVVLTSGGTLSLLSPFLILVGGISGAYVGLRLTTKRSFWTFIGTTAVASACVTLPNALALAILAAEGLRRSTGGEFFQWGRDWHVFLEAVLVVIVFAIAIGVLFITFPALLLSRSTKLSN
jgi:hypothetical protein